MEPQLWKLKVFLSFQGVMMSHDTYTWTGRVASKYLNINQDDDFISYLPLSHSAAQMIDVWMPMASGAAVYFADRNALKVKFGGQFKLL